MDEYEADGDGDVVGEGAGERLNDDEPELLGDVNGDPLTDSDGLSVYDLVLGWVTVTEDELVFLFVNDWVTVTVFVTPVGKVVILLVNVWIWDVLIDRVTDFVTKGVSDGVELIDEVVVCKILRVCDLDTKGVRLETIVAVEVVDAELDFVLVVEAV